MAKCPLNSAFTLWKMNIEQSSLASHLTLLRWIFHYQFWSFFYFKENGSIFEKELNKKNALGLNGRLAICFESFLNRVWHCKKSFIAPIELRDLMCQKFAHFRGSEQQDTQEFMCSFLSILHEDLNRVSTKPFYESGLEFDNESPNLAAQIAKESWNRFLSRENSIVIDNFYGQFKSKLTCLECGKVSITFEPFNNLLVPLPKSKKKFKIILVYQNFKQINPIHVILCWMAWSFERANSYLFKLDAYFADSFTLQEILNELKQFKTELAHSTVKTESYAASKSSLILKKT